MTKFNAKIQQAAKFIKTGIWQVKLLEQPRYKSLSIKYFRIFLVAIREFKKDKCQLRASALTFYSLLSVVPVLAMIFGIAQGFGFETMLESQLKESFAGQQEVLDQMLAFSRSMLENTKGGLIAGIGVAILFWSVMKVLGNIERSFNDIWEIKKSRSLVRKLTDYLSIMLIAPVLMLTAGSATIFISTQVAHITESISLLGFISPLIGFLVNLVPYILVWLLFTFVYIVMPNTKVNFSAALFAGVIAGTGFQITEWVYITFQIGVASYNAIYGSFAALPLFLAWLQISWLVVLFGAELSFAHQNADRYELETDAPEISYSQKKLLSLLVARTVIERFIKGGRALCAEEVSDKLKIPVKIVRQIIFDLVGSGVFSEIRTDNPLLICYQPARSVEKISIKFVLDALEEMGKTELTAVDSEEFRALKEAMNNFNEEIGKSSSNRLLVDV